MDEDRRGRFEQLYAATFKHILGYATRRCDCAEDAADIVAETFTIAWRRMEAVPTGDQARLWLYGVARRVLANHYRKAVRRSDLGRALAERVSFAYVPSVEERAELGSIADIFQELSHDDRELLSLVAWEGLEHAEIAEVLGCSRNAVRIRLHRARKRLSRRLAAAGLLASELATSGREQ